MKKVAAIALTAVAAVAVICTIAIAAESVVVNLRSVHVFYDGFRFEDDLYDDSEVSYDYEQPDSSPAPPLAPPDLRLYDLSQFEDEVEEDVEEEADGYEDEPDAYDEEDDSYDDEYDGYD